jgi:hypothetical protein
MKSLRCLLLIGFVFSVLYLGVSRVLACGADGEMDHLARWLLHEMRRSDALHQRQMEMAEAMKIKRAATTELIAGRMTLREAAKQFSAADAIVQNDSEGLVATYIAPETEQGVYRQVENWAEITVRQGHASQDVEEVRCRLKKERNELLPPTRRLVE